MSIKLPTFCVSGPGAWFAQAEAQFALRHITQDENGVEALDTSTAKRALSVITEPPKQNKYQAIEEFFSSARKTCHGVAGTTWFR